MKKILIISPHFPPSNLAAVHRSRLLAQHLPSFDWEPVILTVHEKYYEEKLDYNLAKLLPQGLLIEKVKAFPVTKPKLIGDIGIRAFFQLYKKARKIIKDQKIDFLYIPIPSFYTALLGRWLNKTTKIPYGIDYIDPWVHTTSDGEKLFSRHWFSEKMAKWLEPIAVKKASIITGVAQGYYEGVIKRNPHLVQRTFFGAMPYGGEKLDHDSVKKLQVTPYLFKKKKDKIQLVYGGAMLPKAYAPLEAIFQAVKNNHGTFHDLEIHFIGTGKSPDDLNGYNIKPLAEKYNLWQTIVFEYPKRIPYLDVLIHLDAADGVFILGSTEPHYTPSKVYQAVLSGKPLLAILHEQSTAVPIIKQSNVGLILTFDGEKELHMITNNFSDVYCQFINFSYSFNNQQVKMDIFNQYSAKNVACGLAKLLDEVLFKT